MRPRETRQAAPGCWMFPRVLLVAAALAFGAPPLLLAQPLPAGHPPLGGGAGARGGMKVEPGIFNVTVRNAVGARTSPQAGVTVHLRGYKIDPPMRGGSGEPELAFERKIITDGGGLARFELPRRPRLRQVEAEVLHEGAPFSTGRVDPARGGGTITLYPAAPAGAQPVFEVIASLTVNEGHLGVDTLVRISASGAHAHRLTGDAARLPFLGLAVGPGGVLDHLITEKNFTHLNLRKHLGMVRLLRKPEGILIEGVITPAAPAMIEVRYPLPNAAADTMLGLRLPFPLAGLRVELEATRRYVPELEVRAPGDLESRTEDATVVQTFELGETVPAGGVLKIEIKGLPVANPLWRRLITILAALVGAGFVLVWIRMKREESRA